MLFKTNDSPLNANIKINRQRFFEQYHIDPDRLVNIYGKHGSDIFKVEEKNLGSGALEAKTRIKNYDSLIIDVKNSYLMVTGADCFPVLFWDSAKNAIAAAHCGWRGILSELPTKIINKFKDEFHSKPADIFVWIGPGIKSCHYEVPRKRADLFLKNHKEYIIIKDDKFSLNLAGIIALQLTRAGVKPEKVTTHPDCTFCEKDKYFSYRRDKLENFEPIEGQKIIQANAYIINLK